MLSLENMYIIQIVLFVLILDVLTLFIMELMEYAKIAPMDAILVVIQELIVLSVIKIMP